MRWEAAGWTVQDRDAVNLHAGRSVAGTGVEVGTGHQGLPAR